MRPIALVNLLKSVSLQTLYPNEILIIDGSTNNETKSTLEKSKIKNLKYFKVPDDERGLTKQRNYGISKVDDNIDIVCFLDDDTILEEDFFEQLIKTYNVYPKALGVGGFITNEVIWKKGKKTNENQFFYDGWIRKDSSRFILRKKLGLLDKTPPGFMPLFSNGRPVSFLPPTNKIYPVEQIMGGVASYKFNIFKDISFANYFVGYGLYEDTDFSLRLAKKGNLYINTAAKLEHHHNDSGRPNKFKYGKMVILNGWYVWRVKYPNPSLKNRIKWNFTAIVLMLIKFTNIFTSKKNKEAFFETSGRLVGLFQLIFRKPNVKR